MMMAESKPVLPTPSERHCVCERERAIGKVSAGGGGVWKIPSGGSQSAAEEIQAEKKVVHKKAAVYLKKRCWLLSNKH